MSEPKKAPVEFRTSGVLAEKGVIVSEQSNIDAFSSRGYGTLENKVFTLTFYESLYLLDKGMLEIKDQKANPWIFRASYTVTKPKTRMHGSTILFTVTCAAAATLSAKGSEAESTSESTSEEHTAKTPHPTSS